MAVSSTAYASPAETLVAAKELRPRGTFSGGTGATLALRQVYCQGTVFTRKTRRMEGGSEGARDGKREEEILKGRAGGLPVL